MRAKTTGGVRAALGAVVCTLAMGACMAESAAETAMRSISKKEGRPPRSNFLPRICVWAPRPPSLWLPRLSLRSRGSFQTRPSLLSVCHASSSMLRLLVGFLLVAPVAPLGGVTAHLERAEANALATIAHRSIRVGKKLALPSSPGGALGVHAIATKWERDALTTLAAKGIKVPVTKAVGPAAHTARFLGRSLQWLATGAAARFVAATTTPGTGVTAGSAAAAGQLVSRGAIGGLLAINGPTIPTVVLTTSAIGATILWAHKHHHRTQQSRAKHHLEPPPLFTQAFGGVSHGAALSIVLAYGLLVICAVVALVKRCRRQHREQRSPPTTTKADDVVMGTPIAEGKPITPAKAFEAHAAGAGATAAAAASPANPSREPSPIHVIASMDSMASPSLASPSLASPNSQAADLLMSTTPPSSSSSPSDSPPQLVTTATPPSTAFFFSAAASANRANDKAGGAALPPALVHPKSSVSPGGGVRQNVSTALHAAVDGLHGLVGRLRSAGSDPNLENQLLSPPNAPTSAQSSHTSPPGSSFRRQAAWLENVIEVGRYSCYQSGRPPADEHVSPPGSVRRAQAAWLENHVDVDARRDETPEADWEVANGVNSMKRLFEESEKSAVAAAEMAPAAAVAAPPAPPTRSSPAVAAMRTATAPGSAAAVSRVAAAAVVPAASAVTPAVSSSAAVVAPGSAAAAPRSAAAPSRGKLSSHDRRESFARATKKAPTTTPRISPPTVVEAPFDDDDLPLAPAPEPPPRKSLTPKKAPHAEIQPSSPLLLPVGAVALLGDAGEDLFLRPGPTPKKGPAPSGRALPLPSGAQPSAAGVVFDISIEDSSTAAAKGHTTQVFDISIEDAWKGQQPANDEAVVAESVVDDFFEKRLFASSAAAPPPRKDDASAATRHARGSISKAGKLLKTAGKMLRPNRRARVAL